MCVLSIKTSEAHNGFDHRYDTLKTETNGIEKTKSRADKEKQRKERERIVLWYEPVLTLKYSALETLQLLRTHGERWVAFRDSR